MLDRVVHVISVTLIVVVDAATADVRQDADSSDTVENRAEI
jgi:hypothetical protein